MTKVINSLQTNEDQEKEDILVPIPAFVLVFGVEAIAEMMSVYIDNSDITEPNHIHSAINLLACLTPHLTKLSKL